MVIIPPVQQLTLFKVKRPQKQVKIGQAWQIMSSTESSFTKFVISRVWTLELSLPGHIWIVIYLLDDLNYSVQSKLLCFSPFLACTSLQIGVFNAPVLPRLCDDSLPVIY